MQRSTGKWFHRKLPQLTLKPYESDYGLTLDDKSQAKKIVEELIDPNSITNLKDDGMDKINVYASGGVDYLQSKISKPYFAEEFLISYVKLLQKEMDNNHNW